MVPKSKGGNATLLQCSAEIFSEHVSYPAVEACMSCVLQSFECTTHLPECQLSGTQLKQEKETPFCLRKIPTTLIISGFHTLMLNRCTVPMAIGFSPHKSSFVY